jgi:hypothetical protein
MSAAKAIVRELLALFVDDGALALGILAVVLAAGVLCALVPTASPPGGALLLFGSLAVLAVNVARAGRR